MNILQNMRFFLVTYWYLVLIVLFRKIRVVGFAGMPGSGKGYVTEKLEYPLRSEGVAFLGCSAILNACAQCHEHPYRVHCMAAQTRMREGKLVSNWLILALMLRKIFSLPDSVHAVVVDGLPRTAMQAWVIAPLLHSVILLQVDESVARVNLAKRAEKEGRPDDAPEVVARRCAMLLEKQAEVLRVVRRVYALTFGQRGRVHMLPSSLRDQAKVEAVDACIPRRLMATPSQVASGPSSDQVSVSG